MMQLLLVEDHARLREGLKRGLEATNLIEVCAETDSGEEAIELCIATTSIDVILMDVALAGVMNGIQAAVAIRREFPRRPIVFYSIQDDDAYYRAFRQAGILSHYAYVRKSNYLLPEMILPLLEDAIKGRSFIDPDIEARVQEVTQRDRNNPMSLLEPNEQVVVRLLARGMTNEQIAAQLGFRDKRTISRTNGEIYSAWGLVDSTTDEKIARTRAAIIAITNRLLRWNEDGQVYQINANDIWVEWTS